MARSAVRALLRLAPHLRLELADLDGERAARVATSLDADRVTASRVDVLDPAALGDVVARRRLVVNATGPLLRTGAPVIEACVAHRTPYLDFGDTYEAAEAAYAFDAAAREAGVPVVICAGLVPGLGSLMAVHLARGLERVDGVVVDWLTGPTVAVEGAGKSGRALVEHMVHESTGRTLVLDGGRLRSLPAFRSGQRVTFPAPVGDRVLYAVGHAEVVTLPRALEGVRDVRVNGGLSPAWLAAVFQGLGGAIDAGRLRRDDAVDFMAAIDAGRPPATWRPLGHALAGVAAAWRRRELTGGDVADLVRTLVRRRFTSAELTGALRVEVTGETGGHRVRRTAERALRQSPGGGGMDELTGTPLAAVAHLILDGHRPRAGVAAVEEAFRPEEVFDVLHRLDVEGFRGFLPATSGG